ncbi:hypothetical protein G6F56_013062 [Rhizopus delemar]|nr:hypothetical protein G6F56_013062 [Rhizopus delemar]
MPAVIPPKNYKETIKQLVAQTAIKPYGNIPPLKQRKRETRRMSHVEDWILVDSKEYLPDEQELDSTDFSLAHVLPLHMPPPSLSEKEEKQPIFIGRPSTTTRFCSIPTLSPHVANIDQNVWNQTIAKLKQSLIITPKPKVPKRRSEATTRPRFNQASNTLTRDTRSNPDHLRMISAELNMIRSRKLLSPLKPRGFLPRRRDPFIRGNNRKVSPLALQI